MGHQAVGSTFALAHEGVIAPNRERPHYNAACLLRGHHNHAGASDLWAGNRMPSNETMGPMEPRIIKMHRSFCVPTVIVLWLAFGPTSAPSFAAIDDGVAMLDSGQVRGTLVDDDANIWAFKGVPFATPPVGERRWQPPQPAAVWQGVRAADNFGPRCIQGGRPALGGGLPPMSEDCLYLNVWTTGEPDEALPVMVWIHGGALTDDAGSGTSYDGTRLARRGVVLVTINYRLGPFGYLAHPLLTAESMHNASGNYGVLDQLAALEWIQRNIAVLGGDPNRVTIFGESAGSWSVQTLVATPRARGLFHRAIGESGGVFVSYGGTPALKTVEAEGERFGAALMGASDPSTITLASMRAASAVDVMETMRTMEGHIRTRPVVDGWVLPDTVRAIFEAGQQNRVPVIVGWNANEGSLAVNNAPDDVETYRAWARETYGAQVDTFLGVYEGATASTARAAFLQSYSDRNFGWEMREWARLTKKVGQPSFLYYFSRVPPDSPTGVYHAAEIRYVFDNLHAPGGRHAYTLLDDWVSDLMASYWVAFATTGNPNVPGTPLWLAHTAEEDMLLEFGNTMVHRFNFRKAELDFFDRYYAGR
jgi:para-nitrobenzyl esterase